MQKVKVKLGKFENFSYARNISLQMADGDYCCWMDTDDILVTPQALRDIIMKYPDTDAIKCRVFSSTPHGSNEIIFQNRLFKNKLEYRFRNLVHEDISFSMLEAKAKIMVSDVTFQHLGNIDPKRLKEKNLRNYQFLIKEIKSPEAHPLTYFNMINCLMMRGQKGDSLEALRYIKKAFEKFDLKEKDPLYSKLFVLKGLCCMNCNQVLAAKQSFHTVFDKFQNPEAAVNLAEIYRQESRWEKVIEILEEILKKEGIKIANLPIDMNEIEKLAHGKLGDAYAHKENMQKAEEHYVKALMVNDKDLTIADRLIQILRNRGEEDRAMYMTMRYVNMYPTYWVGWSNMGQYELRAKRYITARVFFQQALRVNPKCKEAMVNIRGIDKTLRGGKQ